MSRTLLILTALLVLALFPAGAHAACGAPASATVFETPEVQVFMRRSQFIACYRPTGAERPVGRRYTDNPDEYHYVVSAPGRRWLHVVRIIDDGYQDEAFIEDQLTDLRTGAKVTAKREDDAIVVAGALVSAGADGVVARHTDGRRQVLDPAAGDGLAATGARVYWRTAEGPRSARLALPAAARARPLPRAYRVEGCRPRRGARLVRNEDEFVALVLTRVGTTTYACRKGRTRRVGIVADIDVVSSRAVAYTRRDRVGVLDLVSGERRELPGAGAADSKTLAAADATGVRVWRATEPVAAAVATGPASEVAVGDDAVYWVDGDGAIKTFGLRSLARPTSIPASTSAIPSA